MSAIGDLPASLWNSVSSSLMSSPRFQELVRQLVITVNDPKRKRRITVAAVASYVAWYLYDKQKRQHRAKEEEKIIHQMTKDGIALKKRVKLDKAFFRQLRQLIAIVLPGIRSKEFLLLSLHIGFLISRTFLSIYVATLDGEIVKSLVDRNGKGFLKSMVKWLSVAIPATYVNSMIRYLESKLSIAFRTRLTQHCYEMYMKDETYYRVGNLDSRLSNADQCLTEDVNKFCSNLAHVHSQISKPLLDVFLMGWQLWRIGNEKAPGSASTTTAFGWVIVYLTAKVLKLIQPNFGRLVAEQAQLEGDLRFVHSRLIAHSEEIAFYRGHEREKTVLHKAYLGLVKHMNLIFTRRIFYNMMEGFFMKYVWSATGLLIIAIPAFFYDKNKGVKVTSDIVSTRTQDFITSKKLLIDAAEAIERILLAFKEVTELAGYTSRVAEMIDVFKDVQKGHYKKQSITQAPTAEEKLDGTFKPKEDIRTKKGTVVESNYIKFDQVPIVSPNGDILVESISFEVRPGMHLLITGPNGCGKSSLFRILGGLWPIYGGTLSKPNYKNMFYIPQRPYLPLGNLRDQVIYPDTVEDMAVKHKTDVDLEDILSWVNLTHILEREGGWDSVNDWKDVLSGGEKQRLAIARLFYHVPRFAILDECTSAVSIDVEGKMYQHAIDLGITLMTVTHRPTLWKYHEYLLQFDGQGGWNFSRLNASARVSMKEEKTRLESQLAGIPKMQLRLRELCNLLGEDSVVLSEAEKNNENSAVKNQEGLHTSEEEEDSKEQDDSQPK